MSQIASFGFNTIRLPFSNECLGSSAAATSIDATARTRSLVGRTPLQVMDAVVAGRAPHGLSVILDRHRPDSGGSRSSGTRGRTANSAGSTTGRCSRAGTRTIRPSIGVDLHNEPHGQAVLGLRRRRRGTGRPPHPGRQRRPGGEPEPADPRRGDRAATGGNHLVGRRPRRRPDAPDPPGVRRPAGLLPARLSGVDLPAVVVRRPQLPGQPRPSGPPTGATFRSRASRPVLLGEFGTQAPDRLRTGSGWTGLVGYLRDEPAELRVLVLQPEQRRHRRPGRRRLGDAATGQARRTGADPGRRALTARDSPEPAPERRRARPPRPRRPRPRRLPRRRRRRTGAFRSAGSSAVPGTPGTSHSSRSRPAPTATAGGSAGPTRRRRRSRTPGGCAARWRAGSSAAKERTGPGPSRPARADRSGCR